MKINFVKIISNHKIPYINLQKINDVLEQYGKVKYMDVDPYKLTYIYHMDKSFSEEVMEDIVEDIFKIDKDIYIENSLPEKSISKDDFYQMTYELSKYIHNSNVRKKVENGWRYGEEFDVQNKTSPLIKDYDMLEDKYKELRPDILQKVMDMIKRRK